MTTKRLSATVAASAALFCAIAGIASATAGAPSAAGITALVGGTVVAIDGGAAIQNATVATVAEAELYVKAGMTPLQALQSATIQAAKMLEMDADAGSITAGKFADIVALSADPVKDIRALRTLDFVMKGGMVVRDDRREITAN
jgi:adenine deaminase